MKAKAFLIAVFCILSLAGCQNSADEVSTSANTTSAVQNIESTETTSAEEVTENEAVQNNTEQSATADSTDGRRLTLEEAKAAALEHAGVNESEVTNVKTEFDYKDGVNGIEVEFDTSSYEYEYEINADNGNIIKVSKEAVLWQTPQEAISTEAVQNNTEQSATADSTDGRRLTLEEAKAAALEHAGVNESEVTNVKTEFDYKDGVNGIEVEFDTSSYEYEYEINADNGNIIKVSKEAVLWQTPQEAISAEDAENIALEHAGLSRNDVTFIKTEYDIDGNRGKYEIEFICGGNEYEYDISAGGEIIKFEIDEIND